MSERVYNFSPGPAVLPEEVLEQAREDLWNIGGSGIGVLEHSHRGKLVDSVFAEAKADCRKLAAIPSEYHVLFLHGGASTQFFMLPANFLPKDGTADYLHTGSWSQKAIQEAERYGRVHVAASSEDANFSYIPTGEQTVCSDAPAYVHLTSNNTIAGTQFATEPRVLDGAWLACDASSDIFSRPIDVQKYGLIYAGAQKNLGPAGVTLVIIREDLLSRPAVRELPAMLRYREHADQDSRYNTPNVFAIYIMGRVFKWILANGGLAEIGRRNRAKAKIIYDVLDASSQFKGTVRADSRSQMNVTFRARSEELESLFIAEAEKQGLVGLKGHRSVGGMRASIYNAFPEKGCEALAQLMREFEARHG